MFRPLLAWFALSSAVACSSDPTAVTTSGPEPTLRRDVPPITRVDQAKPRVFIPPFVDCRPPADGRPGQSEGGQVCTPVAISGATEPGRYFPDQASCEIVRRQRPYWPADPAATPKADDPRLADEAFMKELAWVTEQVAATGCTCCHDSRQTPNGPSQWSIDAKPIWTDTVSTNGIALFTGLADSSILGAYPAEENNGFQRTTTGLPSTDGARLRAFFVAELARRGVSEEQARAIPPFGGPLYELNTKKPTECKDGEGIDPSGRIRWKRGRKARYVYVLEAGSKNPGVPPNLDKPEGTIFRLDVLASADALEESVIYGTTPEGTAQSIPESGRAPALISGRSYQLFVAEDMALPVTNCVFTYR
jgi:hypothetical protein